MADTAPQASPMAPVAPPTKKQRSTQTPGRPVAGTPAGADDAMTRRRAELERLRMLSRTPGTRAARGQPTTGVLKARPNEASNNIPTTAPPVPRPGNPTRVRNSDIFPSVEKYESEQKPAQQPPQQQPPMESTQKPVTSSKPSLPPSTQKKVARRLDPSFQAKVSPDPAPRAKSAPPDRPPPPPSEEPKAKEAPENRETRNFIPRPPPMTPANSTAGAELAEMQQSSSARREFLQRMREVADTPSKSPATPVLSSEMELEKALLRQQKEKDEALRKVMRLEEQLQTMKERKPSSDDLAAVLEKAQQEGDEAAMKYARELSSGSVSKQLPQVGFYSPRNGGSSPGLSLGMSPHTPVARKRVATPHPKHKNVGRNAKEERAFLTEATQCIPFEYESPLANFAIRRPYGVAAEDALWNKVCELTPEEYQEEADAYKSSTIEIAARILPDGSLLTISDGSKIRHKKDGEWKDYGSVDEQDRPLGFVLYIDEHANEKDYSLDEICESALAMREQYCASIISTAGGLQAKAAREKKVQKEEAPPVVPKPATSDACVGTEGGGWKDEPVGAEKEDRKSQEKHEDPRKKAAPTQQDTRGDPQTQLEDHADSQDVLTVFIGMFFSSIFWVIWTVLKIPLKLISSSLLIVFALALLSALRLHLMDDHGAAEMGAMMDYAVNRPGIV